MRKFNTNYKRDRLAEQLLCSMVSNSTVCKDSDLLKDDLMDWMVHKSLELASKFMEATKVEQEEEESEGYADYPVIDGEFS